MANSTPGTPSVTVRKKPAMPPPGSLKSQNDQAVLHTRQAQRLIEGRTGSNPIVGLLVFAARAGEICQAIKQDDPYADWILLRVESRLDEARRLIAEKDAQLDKIFKSLEGVSIGLAVSQEPTHIRVSFANPYGYQGIFLLRDYDNLARSALTLIHCGLLERGRGAEIVDACGKAVRRAFQEAMAWRRTGVTREAVRRGDDAARLAKETMGELPEPVLQWEKRARFAPAARAGETAKDGTNP